MRLLRLFLVVLLVGSIRGGFWGRPFVARGQSLAASAAPQQMLPSRAPAMPAAAYPSTATPASAPLTPTPYENINPGLMASTFGGVGAASSPAAPGEFGLAGTPAAGVDLSAASRPLDVNTYMEHSLTSSEPWSWQLLPDGLMYKSYLAGGREPRFAIQWVHDRNEGWLWDMTAGGRVGLVRLGTDNDFWPQGYQLDLEAAAFPRLDSNREFVSNDYRVGVPLTTRQGPFEAKFGYYHLSSHLGDEFLLSNPGFPRINYVRESLLLGMAVYLNPSLRLYSEVGYAFYIDGGAKPWEFQFGADFSPAEPTGIRGAPFFAINGHLRQENDFSGNLAVQTGWQWRSRGGHLMRLGMQYFNGMSDQYQFYNRFEEQIGAGLWYDF